MILTRTDLNFFQASSFYCIIKKIEKSVDICDEMIV